MVSKIVIISWLQKTVKSSGSLVSLSLSASENETTWAKKMLNQIVQSNRILKKEKKSGCSKDIKNKATHRKFIVYSKLLFLGISLAF